MLPCSHYRQTIFQSKVGVVGKEIRKTQMQILILPILKEILDVQSVKVWWELEPVGSLTL